MTHWSGTFKSDKNTGTLYFTEAPTANIASFYFNNDDMNNLSMKLMDVSPFEFKGWDNSWMKIKKQSGNKMKGEYYLATSFSENGEFSLRR